MLTNLPHTTILFALIWIPTGGDGACSNLPQSVSWVETAHGDLLSGTKRPNATIRFEIKNTTHLDFQYHSQLKAYFNLSVEANCFTLGVKQPLDLEKFYREWNHAVLDTIVLTIYRDTLGFEVQVANAPVNEFYPTFNHGPYNTSISELTPKDTVIFNLTDKTYDEDVPKPNLYFAIESYNIHEVDGKDLFDMPRGNGIVTLKRTIDFDVLPRHFYVLNITVKDAPDSTAKTASTTLTVTILDADDQKPQFIVPGCTPPCVVPPFEAIIGVNEMGRLQVTPKMVVIDKDTLNTPMIFTIHSGDDHHLFDIDATIGAITQIQSVRQSGIPDKEFRLVIQVTKQNKPDLSALAILTVKIRERMSDFNGTIPDYLDEAESPPEEDNHLLIPLIVLGVILFIVIIAIVVILLVIRRKQKKTIIRPEDTKSEPQTEEEELPTDRDEHTRSNEKLVSGISSGALIFQDPPSARGAALPPLPSRDNATETESMTQKKKSRRRKKKRVPEIFDGTKDYNMGADPEFFDSSDKSKIKRSTRSYSKDRDAQLRLQVPNDQPPDE